MYSIPVELLPVDTITRNNLDNYCEDFQSDYVVMVQSVMYIEDDGAAIIAIED